MSDENLIFILYFRTCAAFPHFFRLFRASVLKDGMWDTVRVDHGTEFYLSLFMQEHNRYKRFDPTRAPYMQTQSKHVRIAHF